MANLYRLLKPISGAQAVLLEEVQGHIRQAGMESIADVKGETMHTDFVENMLTVHKKYRDLIQEVFQGDQVGVENFSFLVLDSVSGICGSPGQSLHISDQPQGTQGFQ